MLYLLQQLAPYVALSFILGLVVGWYSCARYEDE